MAKGKAKSKSKSVEAAEPIDVDGNEKAVADGEEEVDEEEDEEGGEEYEVEGIVDHKSASGKITYLVSWKGYGPEHNTWEPEEHVSHAESIVKKYWDSKPKNITKPTAPAKRGRVSTSSQQPPAKKAARASNGAARKTTKRSKADADDEEEEADFDATHVDSMDKYQDVADWEKLVESIDTIDRGSEGLIVYMTMTGGEKVAQSSDVAYERCPQKILKFYEAHLKWKMSE